MGAARPWSRTGSTPWLIAPPRALSGAAGPWKACRSGRLGRSRGADPRPTGTGAPFRSGSAADRSGAGRAQGGIRAPGRAARPTGGVGAAAGRREIPPQAALGPVRGQHRGADRPPDGVTQRARAAARTSAPVPCHARTFTNPPAPGCRRTRRLTRTRQRGLHRHRVSAHERSKHSRGAVAGRRERVRGRHERPRALTDGRARGSGAKGRRRRTPIGVARPGSRKLDR